MYLYFIFKVNELSYIGGKHVKAMVKRLMSKLFTDNLLSDYSYTGKKGKKPFSTLFICSVIFGRYQLKYIIIIILAVTVKIYNFHLFLI